MVLLAGAFLAAVALSAGFNMLRQYLAAKLSESLAFSLRQRLFDVCQKAQSGFLKTIVKLFGRTINWFERKFYRAPS